MDFLWYILAQGAILSLVVDALKKVPWVAEGSRALFVAALLNAAAVAVQAGLLNTLPDGATAFIQALASAFAVSVGFYEVKKTAHVQLLDID